MSIQPTPATLDYTFQSDPNAPEWGNKGTVVFQIGDGLSFSLPASKLFRKPEYNYPRPEDFAKPGDDLDALIASMNAEQIKLALCRTVMIRFSSDFQTLTIDFTSGRTLEVPTKSILPQSRAPRRDGMFETFLPNGTIGSGKNKVTYRRSITRGVADYVKKNLPLVVAKAEAGYLGL